MTTARKKSVVLAVVLAAVSGLAAAYLTMHAAPVRVGVLLDLTGPEARDFDEVLDWTVERVNSVGGLSGRPVELVYRDTFAVDAAEAARELAADRTIRFVVGPQTSAEAAEVAPIFIDAGKLLVSPTATAGDLFRMFAGQRHFWRTCQSDVAQARAIMDLLSDRGASKVALVYEQSVYGKTFYDWIGFFATELGMEMTGFHGFGPGDPSSAVTAALAEGPDYVVAVAFGEDAAEIDRTLRDSGSEARLFFTDAAESQLVVDRLGEGTELMTPAADPGSGFEEAYRTRFGYYPWDFLAATHDALLLGLYATARQGHAGGDLVDALRFVVDGRGEPVPWDRPERALELLAEGGSPDVAGASGPLEFDAEFGMDPLETHYAHNVVETRDGVTDFWTVETFSSARSHGVGSLDRSASVGRITAGEAPGLGAGDRPADALPPREDLWAVILASSAGWDNYRHQSDALAMYGLLRRRGVADDRIVLMVIDDVPWAEENSRPGDVHHEVGGPNLRVGAEVDYSGGSVTADTLRRVLLGLKDDDTPVVIESDESSNVFVYLVDHGIQGSFPFENGNALTTDGLADLVDEMRREGRYRQMLVMAEACFGESLGEGIDEPGVLFMTGAAAHEASYGSSYDYEIRQWLADDFTEHFVRAAGADPQMPIEDLYASVYESVIGSHVRLLNHENFGSLEVPIGDFIRR